jgi:acetylglutamate synthase|tara:strand:+ start:329 stop:751 length:423 start_codon:yes stop_codon:yes gene_type:complete
LVSSALAQSGEGANLESGLSNLSTEQINAQIHSTITEAIKTQEGAKSENKANSKLGFLQKVVTLDCFFGGSDCLFKDKKSMMSGQVTEFAKKRFEAGNQDVNQYLSQVKAQVNQDLQANVAIKSLENAALAVSNSITKSL